MVSLRIIASQEGGIPVDSKEGLSLLSGSKLRQPSDSSSDTDTDSDSDSTSSGKLPYLIVQYRLTKTWRRIVK